MSTSFSDWEPLLSLVGALVIALPTAWNRERHSRIMGLRTFPLVAMGACGYVLVSQQFIGSDSADASARIMQGLMSGIGFVGGGAILKGDDYVKGTASAASIWVTGALGAAAGFGYWYLAIALGVINFLVVLVFSPMKDRVPGDAE